jgi:pSer/pThr/pTyr-binding forkhead associated (FHA) protein
MGTKHDEPLDPSQPALILMYGDAGRKQRPLNRDGITVGRGRGCDICLDAPDVSNVHCLITRGADGYHLRDCASRAGTRVNGEVVREGALHDGDILQVGPFSFRVHLPAASAGASPRREERYQRSRRNLAQLALAKRRLLQQLRSPSGITDLHPQKADLERRTAALNARLREYEKRCRILEQAEHDLSRDRESLRAETEAFQERVHRTEEELAKRHKEIQPECQARSPAPQEPAPAATAEEARRLELRRFELAAYARHLGRLGQRLRQRQDQGAQHHEQLSRGFQVVEREQQENSKMREEWAKEQAEAGARLAQQRTALAQAEASLREQRTELTRMMAGLKQMQEAIRTQQNAELSALRTENAQLHQLLATRDGERVEAAERTAPSEPPTQEPRAETDLLRQLLREKDSLVEELRQQLEQQVAPKPITDVDSYEAELNAFRRQLEGDRQKLNEEIEQLRSRNLELDQATRDMELELSRERAELARERQRLERLREDARVELERSQRETGVRDRLEPLHKLREQLTSGGQAERGPTIGQR